jgi:hypothetical protein
MVQWLVLWTVEWCCGRGCSYKSASSLTIGASCRVVLSGDRCGMELEQSRTILAAYLL